jgi:WhiB family redox-sensing transcriptional regulator
VIDIFAVKLPSFTQRAACRDKDPLVFFPAEGSRAYAAKAICRTCPVINECLTYALEYEAEHPGSRWGVYGGTTPRERRTMTTKTRKSA